MDSKFLRAEDLGVRLEMVAGLPIWEPYPVYKHQKAVDRIRATIKQVSPASEAGVDHVVVFTLPTCTSAFPMVR